MLFELSLIPLGTGTHLSDKIAEVLKIIDASGIPYKLTPTSTSIEGDWDEVLPIIKRCHQRMRVLSEHVITSIKIEDQEGGGQKITRNIASVESKVGHPLEKGHPLKF